MEVLTGPVSIAEILRDANNWGCFLAWKAARSQEGSDLLDVDPWTRHVVSRMLACRTPALGCHVYTCDDCHLVRLVPHSCKTAFCSSCGAARTDAWCGELLSEMLDVDYRHLIFTLPQELRHLIRCNKRVLLSAMHRAASRALVSLTAGRPEPRTGINRDRMRAKTRRFLPGMLAVVHTFGSDLKFNPHVHVLSTAGGLSPDHGGWEEAPERSLVRGQDLGREWKKNLIEEIRQAEEKGQLKHPPFGSDADKPTRVDWLLTCVAKKRWWVHIGPSLEQVEGAVRYCCRYTRRPAIGEMRILRYDGSYVDFLYTDYRGGGGKKVMRRHVLHFLDRLIQHIPPKNFIQVRYYGLFAPRVRGKLLPQARRHLEQRKRRRPPADTWERRRRRHGDPAPLACPGCGQAMREYGMLFGSPEAIAAIAGISLTDRLPPRCTVPLSRLHRLSRAA